MSLEQGGNDDLEALLAVRNRGTVASMPALMAQEPVQPVNSSGTADCADPPAHRRTRTAE